MIRLLAKPVAESIQNNVRERALAFFKRKKRKPNLAVVLVGQDPASMIYTQRKGDTAQTLEMDHKTITFPAKINPSEVKIAVEELNADPTVDGILIQRPLPGNFREEEVLYWVSPEKDVDAFHPMNAGKLFLGLPAFRPCTPAGIMELLKFYEINPAGKLACIIGRSSIVGKPMASLLLQADATILHCHSKTPNLDKITKQADILVVAAGKMGLIDRSFVRKGAVVIDVGMHRNKEGKLAGDVQFEAVSELASAITPVPGGVGPMTIAILMQNTIFAAEQRESV